MPLTQAQLSKLDQELGRLYAALLEEVRDELEKTDNQRYVELIGRTPTDTGDESVADLLADLNVGMIDRHVQELRDIEAARKRLGSGGFGTCIDCGGDIGFERLLAYPTAKRCFACQQQHEKTYAHQRTPRL